MDPRPFNPRYGSGQTVTAGAAAVIAVPQEDQQVCVTNTGSVPGYVRTVPTGNATAADMIVPPGAMVILSKGITTDDVRLSHFCATSTTLHIITGNGW